MRFELCSNPPLTGLAHVRGTSKEAEMKVLTVAVPCYNSEAYMKKTLDHLIVGGDKVEVLVIDDGSSDGTLDIAREYERLYPEIVRAVHQENKGHGGAVNTGIRLARGEYFKVCDSDDYFAYDPFMKLLDVLSDAIVTGKEPDVVITNYVYDKQGARHKKVMKYTGKYPEYRVFTWDEVKKPLGSTQYVLMHSLTYKLSLLRENKTRLPEHCFYVDNLMAFQPLIYAKTLFYLNEDLYMYFIGRQDQSVNEKVMLGRVDQQLKVTRMMINAYRPDLVVEKNHMTHLVHYMGIMMTVSSILLLRKGTKESIKERNRLWKQLRKKDMKLFLKLRSGYLGILMNAHTPVGRKITVGAYHLSQRVFGFN